MTEELLDMLRADTSLRSPRPEGVAGALERNPLDSRLLEDCVEGFVEALQVVARDISREDVDIPGHARYRFDELYGTRG